MTTWISRTLIAGAAMAVLAGCVPGGPQATRDAPLRAVTVMEGAVTIAGPEGYCIDGASSRLRGAAPFVLLAPCALLRADAGGGAVRPRALLTATVTEGPGPSAAGYRRFFTEPEGRAALSLQGDGSALRVEEMESAPDGSFRVTVTEPGSGRGAEDFVHARSWRAFFTVDGHIVALSLRSPRDAPLSAERAAGLLGGMVAAVRAGNPAPGQG